MGSNTVVSEKSVQHRAEYTALRSACVHYDGAGGVFSKADVLMSTGRKLSIQLHRPRLYSLFMCLEGMIVLNAEL